MTLKLYEAKDALRSLLDIAIAAYTPPTGQTRPTIRWDNVDTSGSSDAPNPPPQGTPWIWFQVIANGGGQVSLGDPGDLKYRRSGLFSATIFVPLDTGTNYADRLCEVVMNAFDGVQSDGVWLRNVRPNDLGRDRHWHVQRVAGDWQYDDHK